MLYLLIGLVGISIGGFIGFYLNLQRFASTQKQQQTEQFRVPTVVAEIYKEINDHDDPVEDLLMNECRFEERDRYRAAKRRFLRAIRERHIPPEWAQTVVGGFLLEYATTSEIIGLAVGARALKYAHVARWMKEQLASRGFQK